MKAQKNAKDTPVTIGIEVEAEYPRTSWGERDYDRCQGHPAGWERGVDGQMEFRFKGGSHTMEEVFLRCDSLEEYMKKYGIDSFEGQGTHIHVGIRDWLKARYPAAFKSHECWLSSKATALTWAYLAQRQNPIWALIPEVRTNNTWCSPYRPSYRATTPLAQIHNRFVNDSWTATDYCGALETRRHGYTTFECRMFQGTNVLGAVKGWATLLVALIKGAERKLDELDWSKVVALPDNTPPEKVPTRDLFVHPSTYDMAALRKEIKETDFLSEPLLDWMERTVRSKTQLVPFNGDLSEIYGEAYNTSTPLAAAA